MHLAAGSSLFELPEILSPNAILLIVPAVSSFFGVYMGPLFGFSIAHSALSSRVCYITKSVTSRYRI